MKYITKFHIRASTKELEEKMFWSEDLWESKHALDATQRMRRILSTKYQKADLIKISS